MAQSIATDAAQASTIYESAERLVDNAWGKLRQPIIELVVRMMVDGFSPGAFVHFEVTLFAIIREFGRVLMESLLNSLEGDGASLPHDMTYNGLGYRRMSKKTRNAHVSTLFGKITLWRFAYRQWHRDSGEKCIFPLEIQLGLVHGATPALAEIIGRRMAEAGATQSRVIQFLREQYNVSLGVGRLRNITAALSERLDSHRQAAQVQALLEALKTASGCGGNRKPVLVVGRDGITLCDHTHQFWEVATTATITLYDRHGKRLKTVYLAWRPEYGQETMSQMLTDLLTELLEKWDGPLPTLAYVTDCGDNETGYFHDVLAKMRHPRTGKPLCWQRVVDFYHAAERVWTMAAILHGKDTNASEKWARRMLRLLKTKPRGAKRVLHSAATLSKRRKLTRQQRKDFRRAYEYIRTRTQWMRYCDYKKYHIPIGSGVTESACKMVYTQRLKLSGMRWLKAGARHILNLRTALLSGVWPSVYTAHLATLTTSLPQPYAPPNEKPTQNAA